MRHDINFQFFQLPCQQYLFVRDDVMQGMPTSLSVVQRHLERSLASIMQLTRILGPL